MTIGTDSCNSPKNGDHGICGGCGSNDSQGSRSFPEVHLENPTVPDNACNSLDGNDVSQIQTTYAVWTGCNYCYSQTTQLTVCTSIMAANRRRRRLFEINKKSCMTMAKDMKKWAKHHLKKKAPHFVKMVKVFGKAPVKKDACRLTIHMHVKGRYRNKNEPKYKKLLKKNKHLFKQIVKNKYDDGLDVIFTKIDEDIV